MRELDLFLWASDWTGSEVTQGASGLNKIEEARTDVKQLYDRYMITSMVAGFEPVVVEQASGCTMTGADGTEYLDCFSGVAVCNAGHGHPRVLAAAKEQMDKLVHCGTYLYYNPRTAELARRLAEVTPGALQKSFFANSGAEAVEGAMRLAKQFTGHRELVCLTMSFHGRTAGTLSVTGNRVRKKGSGPYLSGIAFAPAPYCYRCPFKMKHPECGVACAEYIEQVLRYQTAGDESFPSVFFRAEVSAGELGELVGQQVAGELYVQAVQEGPVWHSPDGQPVEVAITSVSDGAVEGEVRAGSLVNTDTGQSIPVTGKFNGALQ